ncbi:hypothetical protein [Paenibacillus sp. OV219]|uniref:hypothetical protein n=1 Tax=Paenibacillus sp. OV219 TaxID=1884377 RepID=UPI0008CC7104|nr:hypothetical protein [Paenibacillus sp. OV219]SEP17911.1 hypothetical protein SAMN05518847_1268 [Paenibacillus sp. OV219]
MTIQFVDSRISSQADTDEAVLVTIPVAATPLLFGDIGIQTAGVEVANQGLVRVQLTGFVKVVVGPQFGSVTIQVFREGILIFTSTYTAVEALENEMLGFSAIDFPSAAYVANGQIRYTALIFTAFPNPATTAGARNFSGFATAGNFTG